MRVHSSYQLLIVAVAAFVSPINSQAQPGGDPRPVTITLFLSQDAADPMKIASRLDVARIGYPADEAARKNLGTWMSNEAGKVTLVGLPQGQHILVAQSGAENTTIIPASVPQMRGEHVKRLRPLPKWASDPKSPSPEISAEVEGEGEHERLLITIKNRSDKPYLISEYDLHLTSPELRVFPSGLADGQMPGDTVNTFRALESPRENLAEIPPGESETYSLSWPDLVRQGLWIVRREAIDEPLLAEKDGRMGFRVRGSVPVWLTKPERVLKKSVSLDVTIRDEAGKPLPAHTVRLRYHGKSDYANRIPLFPSRSDIPGDFQRVYLPPQRGWSFTWNPTGGAGVGSDSDSFSLDEPGHYALELRSRPVKDRAEPRGLQVVVKQTPEGVKVVPTREALPDGAVPNAAPNAEEPQPKPVAVPLPEKTPFDTFKEAREMYLKGYRDGYLWASDPERHTHCLTNPSEDNLPVIRGIIEGWMAGVPAAKGAPGDLPAKYAPFIKANVPGKKGGGGFFGPQK